MTSLLALLAFATLMLAVPSALLMRENLRRFLPPAGTSVAARRPAVSVLIPARNEADVIAASVSAALANRGVELEVIVLDDRSEDATAGIVWELARRDDRVRLVRGPELPPGWCGKQHACWVLAHEARYPVLVFVDADVRLAPDALRSMNGFLEDSGADLASGFPRQETVGLLEKLVIPLMHFVLLSFLPIDRMRRNPDPVYAAGCGQLFITRRDAYDRAGGHAAIRATLHDGLKLPRAYRLTGLRTDLFDATDLAVCRMYRSPAAVWNGLAKNAGEGIGSPRLIVPATIVLLGGQVLPVVLMTAALVSFRGPSVPWRSPGCPERSRPRIIPDGRRRSASGNRASERSCTRSASSSWSRFSGTPWRGPWRDGHRPGRGASTAPARRGFLAIGVDPLMNRPAATPLEIGSQPINLTQVLKLAGWAMSGGEAKGLIAEGLVRVNGEVELRKRRQMRVGDVVSLEDGPAVELRGGA